MFRHDADERVHDTMDDVCRYNVDGIWGWNVHDGDWIYQVYSHPCTDRVASSADDQHRWRMFLNDHGMEVGARALI